MSKIKIKNQPSFKLLDLLKRRRTSLKSFIEERGIFTYDSLLNYCHMLGVTAPSIYEYQKALPEPVTSPTDGIIVIESLEIVQGDDEASTNEDNATTEETFLSPKRRKRTQKQVE